MDFIPILSFLVLACLVGYYLVWSMILALCTLRVASPLHQPAAGPPPRAGEDFHHYAPL